MFTLETDCYEMTREIFVKDGRLTHKSILGQE